MIEKNRLKELIEQGATIYRKYADVNVYELKLNKSIHSVDNAHLWKKQNNGTIKKCGYPFENLFETREEAEWELQFGNITRTETLSLPSWEEIEKEYNKTKYKRKKFGTYPIIKFIGKNGNFYSLNIFVDNYNRKTIDMTEFINKSLTKENYTEACKVAKKLFLGEVEE